jgi:type I site-specific restriction-modification system R (restriction) subunit
MQLAYAKTVFKLASDPDVAENPDKYSKRDAAKKLVLEEAERAGLDETKIREILDIEKNSVCSEYAAAVYYYAHKYLNGIGTNELQAELNPIMETHPTPDQLELILDKFNINDPKTRSFVDDYRYYIKTGRQKRPDVWAQRGEWMSRYFHFPDGW